MVTDFKISHATRMLSLVVHSKLRINFTSGLSMLEIFVWKISYCNRYRSLSATVQLPSSAVAM